MNRHYGAVSGIKKLTSANYTKDKLYPAVARAVAEILKTSAVVAPVEVLLRMRRITKQQVEDWRFGRIAYLERVTVGGLGNLSVQSLRRSAHESNSRSRKPEIPLTQRTGVPHMASVKQIVRVLPGHRVEIVVPELLEGDEVEVTVLSRTAPGTTKTSVLEFLDSLPDGPRAFATWQEYEQHLRQERDSWDR